MPIELTVQKIGDNLVPVADVDRHALENVKNGQGFRVEIKQQSARSIAHHRLYWGGLIQLLSDYWEPNAHSRYDRKLMADMIQWIASNNLPTDGLSNVTDAYLEYRALKASEAAKMHEAAHSSDNIHQWLKEEAGHWEAVQTPTGIKRSIKSINFNAMSQEEFNEFYKKAFSVAWRYVFSTKFESQEQAENVAMQMSQMG